MCRQEKTHPKKRGQGRFGNDRSGNGGTFVRFVERVAGRNKLELSLLW